MRFSHFILCIYFGDKVFAGDTNFVAEVNTIWQTRNASNVVAHVDGYLATNRNAEALFVRGVLAAALETWGRGAAHYLEQAIAEAQTNTLYSVENRTHVVNEIDGIRNIFIAIANDAKEPLDSTAQWDTGNQADIFGEVGDEFPFLWILEKIANSQ